MSIFKFKPIIIKGHTFPEYLARCGREYIMGRGEIIRDKSRLKPLHRYWEIDGEYYQVGFKKEARISFTVISIGAIVTAIVLPIYFCVIAPMEKYHDYNFRYWNNAPSLKILKTYVRRAVTPGNKYYVPKKDRIATFDMDGTLFGERSPIYVEWMMFNDYYEYIEEHGTPEEQKKLDRYSDEVPVKDAEDEQKEKITMEQVYLGIDNFEKTRKANDIIGEGGKTVTLEQAEAYLGAILFSQLKLDEYENIVNTFLDQEAECFNNLLYKDMFYKPMIEVVDFLQINNFDVYVVSGTDRFMVRTIVNKHMNIPENKVIGMDVKLELNDDGEVVRGEKLIIKNVEEAKVYQITQEIGKKPVLSFGNSGGDEAMHNFIIHNNKYNSLAFMVVADDLEREFGYTEEELEKRTATWGEFKWFSMKNDWKTIYDKNVTKK